MSKNMLVTTSIWLTRDHEHEGTNGVQSAQEEHQMDEGNLADSQITGEQKEDAEPKSMDGSEVGQIVENNKQHKYINDHRVDIKKKHIYIYPGVSSQKRVKLRAEQLFKEGQADKAIKKQE
eukprot:14277027-Heterocapsa_arctica.AAC.1